MLDVDYKTAKKLTKLYKFSNVFFIMPPSIPILIERLENMIEYRHQIEGE